MDTMKPKLSPAACALLYRFVDYVKRYSYICHNGRVSDTASDVMDGHYYHTDPVPMELRKKGIIRNVSSGGHKTWELTEYGCLLVTTPPPLRYVDNYSI